MARNTYRAAPLYDKKVSTAFRETVLELFPSLAANPAYLRLFSLLFFKMVPDSEYADRAVIPHPVVAWCERKHPNSKGYRSGEFLQRFSLDVYDLGDLDDWDYETGRARNLNPVPHEDELIDVLGVQSDTYVNFVTGRPWGTHDDLAIGRARQRAITEMKEAFPDHPLIAVASYLHGLPSICFRPNVYGIREAERQLTPADTPKKLSNLRRVYDLTQDHRTPWYEPSDKGKTARIFSPSPLFGLSYEVRKILYPSWIDLDLKSSQLAINAYLWGATETLAYLQGGRPFWSDMLTYLGVPPDKKPALKKLVYAFLYGMTRKALIQGAAFRKQSRMSRKKGSMQSNTPPAEENVIAKEKIIRFLEHPLMVELDQARELQMQKIRSDGGAYDYFGKWITYAKHWLDDNVRSILAEVSQSYELGLILPAFDYAKGNPDFNITLFQHDGFSVRLRDRRREGVVIKRIQAIVNRECRNLGIPTCLEIRE